MHGFRAFWALLLLAGGCLVFDAGVVDPYDGDAAPPPVFPADAAAGPVDAPHLDAAREVARDEAGVPGKPEQMGCADGTREGFISLTDWPAIAGCSGAWSLGGLLSPEARAPACMREAGNDGLNAFGEGCGVADLCAAGWRVCRDANDVRRHSPSGCESAVNSVEPRFFLVLAGASAQGICSPDRNAANDLHGCGNLGQSESSACEPLNRRMTFAECQASRGVWVCGGPGEHLTEAALVSKSDSALGGALCCRE
jgi:hypothetical protein